MDADQTSQTVVSVQDAALVLEKLHIESGDILALHVSDQISAADLDAVVARLGQALRTRRQQRVLLVVLPAGTDLKALSDEDLEQMGLVRKGQS